jgi:hypothetical protein
MTRTELIIQILKVVIGLALGAYFVWWSLEVLDRLSPNDEAPTSVVRRIFKANRFPDGTPWQWTLTYDEDRSPTHGYEPTGEAAMQAFARSWHREA